MSEQPVNTASEVERLRLEQILDAMAVGYLAMDADWRITYVNAQAVKALGLPREGLVGGIIWELFPATVGSDFEAGYRRAAETGELFTFDSYYPAPLDAWYEVRAVPENGGVALYFLDITARKHAQDIVEQSALRLQLLATVTTELTETLDAEQAVARLAQLVVPTLADWCVITLVEDDTAASTPTTARASRTVDLRRGLRDVGWWHRDEAARPLVQAYAAHRISELNDSAFLLQALRDARPVLVTDSTAAMTAVLDPDGQAHRLLAQLAPHSSAIFPLRGRGRTVGLMTLFNNAERSPIAVEEVATAAEVAARAGLALDSARLYRQQRNLAEGLQRSLLTAPPEPDHGQLVVRYLPAVEAAQVGGDWYDAFLQPGGATVLVIGDVVGHDVQAAAAMSQVRTIMRAFGALGDDSPAEILAKTDRVMANLQVSTTATAIAARVEQTLDERARGVTRLRWTNAGHPPAMVIHADASVQPLVGLSTDLLLGVVPDVERDESEVVLDRGATVLLYTDGLVERRDQSLQVGLERLQATLEELAAQDLSLDDLLDHLLKQMVPAHPEDDVALIAVRLHRQDRPRPVEAGPQRVPDHVPAEPTTPAGDPTN
ncbi:SpoIIE family protein phosphatase [Kineococcus sp. R86509]|uniref:SpoIIE family protein phosphatase n=1 Tax=Kineococcus sp. R86509 TaxID=3093851 RepID=UPI0036D43009